MSATFSEPNLIGSAGLVPANGLASQVGLVGLGQDHVRLAGPGRANAGVKLMSIIVGGTTHPSTPGPDQPATATLPAPELAMGHQLAANVGQNHDPRDRLNPKPRIPQLEQTEPPAETIGHPSLPETTHTTPKPRTKINNRRDQSDRCIEVSPTGSLGRGMSRPFRAK